MVKAHMVKGSAAAKRHMARLRGMVGKGKGKSKSKKSSARRVSSNPSNNPGNNSSSKKMTVGKLLDLGAIGGPAAHRLIKAWQDNDFDQVKFAIPEIYSGYDFATNTFRPEQLIKGYGGAVNRGLEKKLLKMVGVKGPRSKIKTFGDVLDHVTWWGKTAIEVAENKDNPAEAARLAYQTQYGIDLEGVGTAAYTPLDMLVDKTGPYILQKMVRKGLRALNIKMPSFNLGG